MSPTNPPLRPNVLMVCVDHWPGRLLGAAGHEVIQSPTLDRLAESGIRFSRAYSECPVCIPARRTLMTGTLPRTHGDRVYTDTMTMPEGLPTLARCFRDAGYQAYAVGKMHVYPQRDRVGFDDVILAEEARTQFGVVDDYQAFLGDHGWLGLEYAHGMCNNDYQTRPWHLPEEAHATTWATRQMCRMIRRRDPTRPGLFYLSYCHPHPPLVPLQAYLDLYDPGDLDMPHHGDWAHDEAYPLQALQGKGPGEVDVGFIRRARRAFYALCTHIDHQLRLVIGTLREEGILGNTIVLFTCDHGDMLGTHGMWGKRVFYEGSANVPMILSLPGRDVPRGVVDDRLVGLADVMPTLLELAGIDVPGTVEGLSMLGQRRRETLFGEISELPLATRMVHDGRYKLIYYPVGNVVQLFDIDEDPRELTNLADSPGHARARAQLEAALIAELYKGDEAWARDGRLVGVDDRPYAPSADRALNGQRGLHWPPVMKTRRFEGPYA